MKKIAVLGVGSIGQRHLENLTQLNCGVRAYDIAHRVESSYREEIIDWADAVVITTPTPQHWDDIHDCVCADKPMFVEKPVGHYGPDIRLTPEELRDFILMSQLIKMVGYNLRFHSCVKKVKTWLSENKIGRLLWANFTCAQFNGKPDYLRDGVILNWSHEIDLALFLIGKARVVSSFVMNNAHGEDIADIILRHPDGCQTTVHLDYVTDPEIRGFTITGTEGVIVVDLRKRSAVLHRTDGVATVYAGPDSFEENYLDEMRAFLMRLDGQPTLGCTAQEGLDVLDICLKAKEMAR